MADEQLTEPHPYTPSHQWMRALVAAGACTAEQALSRVRQFGHDPALFELDYVRAELKHRSRQYGQASATIGELRGREALLRIEVAALDAQLAEAHAERDRIRRLWPLNGFGEDVNIRVLMDNHRQMTERAYAERDAALAALVAAGAAVPTPTEEPTDDIR